MWMVDPDKMCDQHLLGEHHETHVFLGRIEKGMSISQYTTRGMLEPTALWVRHEQLVREMARRGMIHQSPFPAKTEFKRLLRGLPREELNAKVDPIWSLSLLRSRCERCREGAR
jgi:hypothetical protein